MVVRKNPHCIAGAHGSFLQKFQIKIKMNMSDDLLGFYVFQLQC